jgi:hypothetical protein
MIPTAMSENIIWLLEQKCDINQGLLIGSRVNRYDGPRIELALKLARTTTP